MFTPEILLILYLMLALGVSFLCSLTESGILSLSRARVAALVKEGRKSGRILQGMKANIERPLSAILTLNTIAHTVGAAGVGAESYAIWGNEWVAVTSAVLTVLILVFSEIIPKTLGVVYASSLASFTAYTITAMIYMTYPLVVVFQLLSRMLGQKHGHELTREEFAVIAELGQTEGALQEEEYKVIRNLLQLRKTKVESVMTPRTVVFMLQKDMTVKQAIDGHAPFRFARMPIYAEDADSIVGVVLRHALHGALQKGQGDSTLESIADPVHAVPQVASLDAVLDEFVESRSHLFLVVDEHGGTAGIITLEDAIETLLGREIMDETDQVADMRQLAGQLFQSKLRGRTLLSEAAPACLSPVSCELPVVLSPHCVTRQNLIGSPDDRVRKAAQMVETFKQLITNQYEAAFCTLHKCIEGCPEDVWTMPVASLKFGQVVFHTVFFADYYTGPNAEAFRSQTFHRDNAETFDDYEELQDRAPVTLHARGFVRRYLEHCRRKASDVNAAETAESLSAAAAFERRDFTRAELHVYNIRHIQHHAAQLILRLRLDTDVDIPWVGSGWRGS